MNSAGSKAFISFPPGLITDSSLRIPVIAETAGWIALNKPGGIAVRQHPWNFEGTHLDDGLNRQLLAKKPELTKSGATLYGSVYTIDPQISGVTLFAKHRNNLDQLRNLVGSEKLQFKFLMVTWSTASNGVDELTVDAPLLRHNTKPKMIPSTAKGKKALTHFRCIQKTALGWSLWEARTLFPRLHQVRAHASLGGIAVLGDSLYSGTDVPLLSDLLPGKTQAALARPVFGGIALHLDEVLLPNSKNPSKNITLKAGLPKRFGLLLDRLKFKYSG